MKAWNVILTVALVVLGGWFFSLQSDLESKDAKLKLFEDSLFGQENPDLYGGDALQIRARREALSRLLGISAKIEGISKEMQEGQTADLMARNEILQLLNDTRHLSKAECNEFAAGVLPSLLKKLWTLHEEDVRFFKWLGIKESDLPSVDEAEYTIELVDKLIWLTRKSEIDLNSIFDTLGSEGQFGSSNVGDTVKAYLTEVSDIRDKLIMIRAMCLDYPMWYLASAQSMCEPAEEDDSESCEGEDCSDAIDTEPLCEGEDCPSGDSIPPQDEASECQEGGEESCCNDDSDCANLDHPMYCNAKKRCWADCIDGSTDVPCAEGYRCNDVGKCVESVEGEGYIDEVIEEEAPKPCEGEGCTETTDVDGDMMDTEEPPIKENPGPDGDALDTEEPPVIEEEAPKPCEGEDCTDVTDTDAPPIKEVPGADGDVMDTEKPPVIDETPGSDGDAPDEEVESPIKENSGSDGDAG